MIKIKRHSGALHSLCQHHYDKDHKYDALDSQTIFWIENKKRCYFKEIVVPPKYKTDGYSIPKCLVFFLDKRMHTDCCLLHDYMCDTAPTYKDRLHADYILYIYLKQYKVSFFKALLIRICCSIYGIRNYA